MPLFLYRGEGEAGSLFGEVFQGDSSGISGAFQRGFPSCFYGKIWEQEGKRGWKGGEDVGEGEEKLKSEYGKNKFCDHTILQFHDRLRSGTGFSQGKW